MTKYVTAGLKIKHILTDNSAHIVSASKEILKNSDTCSMVAMAKRYILSRIGKCKMCV